MDVMLRPWRPEDAPSIARHADDPQVAANLRDVFPCPYQLSDAEEFIRLCRAAEPEQAIFRAIVVDGQAVGSVALTRGTDVCRRSAELGYWLGRALWGRGIMTKAVEEMCRTGFEAWDIVRIYAEPFAHNAGSRRVLEKAGFALEGVMRSGIWKNGRLRDYCMYAAAGDPVGLPQAAEGAGVLLQAVPQPLEEVFGDFPGNLLRAAGEAVHIVQQKGEQQRVLCDAGDRVVQMVQQFELVHHLCTSQYIAESDYNGVEEKSQSLKAIYFHRHSYEL